MASVSVILAAPAPTDWHPGIRVAEYSSEESLRALIDQATAALVPVSLFQTFLSLERTATRLVVDLSDRPATRTRALLAGDFFLCRTEAERESWLRALVDIGRVPPSAQQDERFRRLIDVLGSDFENECAVDPLRLYCTSTLRQPYDRSSPSRTVKALRIARHQGIIALIRRIASDIRLQFAPHARMVAERLARADSIAAFQLTLAKEHLIGPDPRFMDLEIDLSNKCNIRCRMCYFSFDEVFYGKAVHLTPDTFAPLAEAILPHARAVMLSLGSEPLTSPHFASILSLASRYGVPELGFYTNGLLLTERVIDLVIEHGVTVVAVSVDGATKRTYEAIRCGANFDVLLRNVRQLARRRAENGGRLPRIRFGVVLMRQNIEELPDLVTLAWRLGVEELNFFHAVVYEGLDMGSESLLHYRALSNRCLAHASSRAAELGLKIVHQPHPFDEAPVATEPRLRPHLRHVPYCRFPFFHVSMDSLGQVRACPFSHGEPSYGTVTRETPFERIWLGQEFADLRHRILTNNPPEMCRRCSFLASNHPDVAELFQARRH
jgi:MoaA/NifB/PqqE/SkfB family radical SAM enzyme